MSTTNEIPKIDDMIYELGKTKDGQDDDSPSIVSDLIKLSEKYLVEMGELSHQGKHYEVIMLCEDAMQEYKKYQEELRADSVENNAAKLQILHSIAAMNFTASTSAEIIKDYRKAIDCLNVVMQAFPHVANLLPMFYLVRAANYGLIGEHKNSISDLENYEAMMDKQDRKIEDLTRILIMSQKIQMNLAMDKHVEALTILSKLRKVEFEDVKPEEPAQGVREGETEEDKKYVDPRLKKSVCQSTADFWSGVLHFKQGNYAGAIEYFESFDRHREAGTVNELFLVQDWYEKYLRQLFGACHATGNYQGSAKYLKILCDMFPDEIQYQQLYAETLMVCQKPGEARAIYENLEKKNNLADYNPTITASYANCLVGLHDFAKAYSVTKKAMDLNPGDSTLEFFFLELRMQCLIHCSTAKDTSTMPFKPDQLYQELKTLVPTMRGGLKDGTDEVSLYKRSQLDVLEAQLLSWKNEDEPKQFEFLNRATLTCPTNFHAWMNTGLLQQANGDDKGVMDTLNKIKAILGEKAAQAAKQHFDSVRNEGKA